MRAVVQRVRRADVTVDGAVVGAIDEGFLVLLGAGRGDTEADADYLVRKIVGLRVFRDDSGQMNLDLQQVGGALLVVSQFTLYGDCRRGRRPSFGGALAPDEANRLCDYFVARAREAGLPVETGRFGAMMDVSLLNDGPVTLLLDSRKLF